MRKLATLVGVAVAVLALRPIAAQDASDPGPAVRAARSQLAGMLGVPEDATSISRAEPVTWNDACLGAPPAGLACAQVTTDGWVLWLRSPSGVYRFHTDLDGAVVRVGDGPLPDLPPVIELPLPEGATLRLGMPQPPASGSLGAVASTSPYGPPSVAALVVGTIAVVAVARSAARRPR